MDCFVEHGAHQGNKVVAFWDKTRLTQAAVATGVRFFPFSVRQWVCCPPFLNHFTLFCEQADGLLSILPCRATAAGKGCPYKLAGIKKRIFVHPLLHSPLRRVLSDQCPFLARCRQQVAMPGESGKMPVGKRLSGGVSAAAMNVFFCIWKKIKRDASPIIHLYILRADR